jgi:hypothetical protein
MPIFVREHLGLQMTEVEVFLDEVEVGIVNSEITTFTGLFHKENALSFARQRSVQQVNS